MAGAVTSALLARTAAQVQSLVLVLFVLARFHSAPLAGLAVMVAIVPGLLFSPVAGALLDRAGRVPLIALDYAVGALAYGLLSALALAHALARWELLVIVGAAAVTYPLSNTGTRSLFPLVVPRVLWDRANALDSGGYVVATVVGPALAGGAVALVGSAASLALPSVLLLGAAACLIRVRVPPPDETPGASLWRDAVAAFGYVARHRVLRMLAVTLSVLNLGWGALQVGLPLLVLRRLHGGSPTVGLLFAVLGGAGIGAGLLAGRLGSEGRERRFLVIGCAVSAPAVAALALCHSVAQAAVAMAVLGAANGPIDIGLFSLRQRVTDPAWLGRAFAVSMSLNFLGVPLGAAAGGPLFDRGLTVGFLAAGAAVAVSAVLPFVME